MSSGGVDNNDDPVFKTGSLFQVMGWSGNPSVEVTASKSRIVWKVVKSGLTTGQTIFCGFRTDTRLTKKKKKKKKKLQTEILAEQVVGARTLRNDVELMFVESPLTATPASSSSSSATSLSTRDRVRTVKFRCST
jgi:hypothetical protein